VSLPLLKGSTIKKEVGMEKKTGRLTGLVWLVELEVGDLLPDLMGKAAPGYGQSGPSLLG
jgi:hypothetical protein